MPATMPATVDVVAPIECWNGTIPRGRYHLRRVTAAADARRIGRVYDLIGVGIADGGGIGGDTIDACLRDGSMRPVDPAQPAREAQLLRLRAAAPLRAAGGRHSADVVGLPLFEPCLL